MAAIKNSDVIDNSVQKAFEDLNKALAVSVESLRLMVEQGAKINQAMGGAKTIKDLTTSQEKYNVVLKDTKAEQIQAAKLAQEEERLKRELIKTQNLETNERKKAEREQQKQIAASAKASSLYAQESAKLTELRNKAREAGLQFGMNSKQYNELATQVQNADKKLKTLDANLGVHNRRVGQYENALKNAKGALIGMAAGYIGFQGAVRIIGDVINKNKEFEKSLSSLRAITGVSTKDLKFFADAAKATSSRTLQGANDIVKAYELIGSKRPELLKNKEALAEVTEQAIILSEATGGQLGLEDAAISVAGALNQFGLASSDAAMVINVLAAGSKEGAAAIPSLSQAIDKFGAVAKSGNITIQQSVGLLETLAEKNIEGAEAGTQLRNIFIKLMGDQKNYKNGLFDLSTALGNLRDANYDVTELTKLFGKENVVAAQILSTNTETVDKYTKAVTGTNVALEQQAIQNDNLAGKTEQLKKSWDNLMLSFSTSSGATGVISTLTKIVQGLRYEIEGWDKLKIDKANDFFKNIKSEASNLGTTEEKLKFLTLRFDVINELWKENTKQISATEGKWNEFKGTLTSTFPILDYFVETNKEENEELKLKDVYYNTLLDLIDDYIATIKEESKTVVINKNAIDEENKSLEKKIQLKDELNTESESRVGDVEFALGYADEIEKREKARTYSEDKVTENLKKNIDERINAANEENEKLIALEQEREDFKKELLNQTKDNAINSVNTIFDTRIDNLEKEKEAIEDNLQKQLANETLTQEQRSALEAKAEVEKAKIRKKQNQEATRQALFNRALAIADIFKSTRVAFMKALELFPISGGMPWSGLALASGALQTAAVLGQPIPRYEKGTKHSKGGIAEVAEKGAELIVDKKFGAWIANDRQHTVLSEGSQVYTASETSKILNAMTHADIINSKNTAFQMPLINKMISANEKQTRAITDAIKNQKINIYNQQGISSTVMKKQDAMITWLTR